MAERTALHPVLNQLIRNAGDAMPDGGGSPSRTGAVPIRRHARRGAQRVRQRASACPPEVVEPSARAALHHEAEGQGNGLGSGDRRPPMRRFGGGIRSTPPWARVPPSGFTSKGCRPMADTTGRGVGGDRRRPPDVRGEPLAVLGDDERIDVVGVASTAEEAIA